LADYFREHLPDQRGMVCRTLGECCRSATVDQFGRVRPDVAFVAGQLPHVGAHYDLREGGRPIRILVIAMETGRPDEGVSMLQRRVQLSASADLPMMKRNPHMQGVMSALRLAVGRAPGVDREGELLHIVGEELPVHLFDAYAMTNLRLCSAYKRRTDHHGGNQRCRDPRPRWTGAAHRS
jgi:hypothetical protein